MLGAMIAGGLFATGAASCIPCSRASPIGIWLRDCVFYGMATRREGMYRYGDANEGEVMKDERQQVSTSLLRLLNYSIRH